MLAFYFESKLRTFASVSEVREKLQLQRDLTPTDLEQIRRAERKGEHLYAGINPYVNMDGDCRSLTFRPSAAELAEHLANLSEEI